MKKIVGFICLLVLLSYGEVTHSGLTGTNIHTPYRWLFADSAARVNQSVVASDTMKLAYQRSDSSTWVLVATTGTKWRKLSIAARFVGTDAILSDSVSAATAVFTNVSISPLTTYYMPYKAATGYMADGPFYTNGTNVAQGRNTLEPWHSTLRAFLVGGNSSFVGSSSQSGTAAIWFVNNGYNISGNYNTWRADVVGAFSAYKQENGSHAWYSNTGLNADSTFTINQVMSLNSAGTLTTIRDSTQDVIATDSIKGVSGTFSGALVSTTLNTGNGANELYAMDQNVRTTDAVTFATVNTGNGANELYPMDQDVRTTASVTHDSLTLTKSVRAARGVFDSITTNGTDYFTYSTGTFPCTLTTASVTVQQIGTAKYEKWGKFVRIILPPMYGTSNSATMLLYCGGLPAAIRPTTKPFTGGFSDTLTTAKTSYAQVLNNGLPVDASFSIRKYSTVMFVYVYRVPDTGFTTSGIKGLFANTIMEYYLE